MPQPLNTLGVVTLREGLRAGRISAPDVVAACLERIERRDDTVKAWVRLDPAGARQEAARADSQAALGGIPFAAKDVFRTARLPTGMGSAIYEGSTDRMDAASVGLLRRAGAVLLGKTATAEFAGTAPAETTHPLSATHTPGGSSSGSAAAVADHMVPFALGTQTGGSVIRPAAFCGVVGFKPSFGLYPVDGMKMAAQSFDTVGLIARSAEDIALLHGVFLRDASAVAEGPMRIGMLQTHLDDTLQPAAAEALERAVRRLAGAGCRVIPVSPPAWFRALTAHRAVINAFERHSALAPEALSHLDAFRPETRTTWEGGLAVSGTSYLAARAAVDGARAAAGSLFDGVDVLVTAPTPGEAPEGLHSTGDPRLQELWTTLHLPSVCLPIGHGPAGLPLSMQMVAPLYRDTPLLAASAWAERILTD